MFEFIGSLFMCFPYAIDLNSIYLYYIHFKASPIIRLMYVYETRSQTDNNAAEYVIQCTIRIQHSHFMPNKLENLSCVRVRLHTKHLECCDCFIIIFFKLHFTIKHKTWIYSNEWCTRKMRATNSQQSSGFRFDFFFACGLIEEAT